MNQRIRLDYLDAARGIAIIGVIIGHMFPRDYGIGQYIYSFHMPIFFVISGMLLFYCDSWKNHALIDNIKRKSISLLYPYVTFSVLSILIIILKALIEGDISNNVRNLTTACLQTLLFDGIQTLWFLPALFIAQTVFITLYCKVKSKWIVCGLSIITVITTSILANNFDFRYATDNNIILLIFVNIINRAMIGFLFLLMGYIVAQSGFYDKISIKCQLPLIFGLILVNLLLYESNHVDLHYSIIGNPIIYYLNALCGSFGIIFLSRFFFSKSKILAFYGKNSLIIFATHHNLQITVISAKIAEIILSKHNAIAAFIIVIIIESIIIYIINHYLQFLIRYNTRV